MADKKSAYNPFSTIESQQKKARGGPTKTKPKKRPWWDWRSWIGSYGMGVKSKPKSTPKRSRRRNVPDYEKRVRERPPRG